MHVVTSGWPNSASGGMPLMPIGPRVRLSQFKITSATISPIPSVAIVT